MAQRDQAGHERRHRDGPAKGREHGPLRCREGVGERDALQHRESDGPVLALPGLDPLLERRQERRVREDLRPPAHVHPNLVARLAVPPNRPHGRLEAGPKVERVHAHDLESRARRAFRGLDPAEARVFEGLPADQEGQPVVPDPPQGTEDLLRVESERGYQDSIRHGAQPTMSSAPGAARIRWARESFGSGSTTTTPFATSSLT